jgi:1,2-diacylglycerol 3-beta-galactosyltransferase
MSRLLFLIADTGGGHRAAANAVAAQLRTSSLGPHDITILDPFAQSSPRLVARGTALYGPLTRLAPWAWGALYHASNSRAAVASLERSLLRLVEPGIRRAATPSPDAIVSFHPLLNHATVRVARNLSPRPRVATVITDLVDVHASWACAAVDAVVVPSPGGWDRCRRAGVAADRCHQIGLAVDPRFATPPADPAEKAALRERLGLTPGRIVLLLCGGADGSGGIARKARALAEADLDIDLVVICGRNARAARRLANLADGRGRRAVVRGFVDNMPEWFRAADIVATKAGPSTIAEALCWGLPLLLTFYLPGQERGNVEWIVDSGAGRYVPTAAQLVDAVAELAVPGSATLQRMRDTALRLAQPAATARIAALIEELAGAGNVTAALEA